MSGWQLNPTITSSDCQQLFCLSQEFFLWTVPLSCWATPHSKKEMSVFVMSLCLSEFLFSSTSREVCSWLEYYQRHSMICLKLKKKGEINGQCDTSVGKTTFAKPNNLSYWLHLWNPRQRGDNWLPQVVLRPSHTYRDRCANACTCAHTHSHT